MPRLSASAIERTVLHTYIGNLTSCRTIRTPGDRALVAGTPDRAKLNGSRRAMKVK